jgi:hypothetical protein
MTRQASEWKTAEELRDEKEQSASTPRPTVEATPLREEARAQCWVCKGDASDRGPWVWFLGQPRVPLCADCQKHGLNVAAALPYLASLVTKSRGGKR